MINFLEQIKPNDYSFEDLSVEEKKKDVCSEIESRSKEMFTAWRTEILDIADNYLEDDQDGELLHVQLGERVNTLYSQTTRSMRQDITAVILRHTDLDKRDREVLLEQSLKYLPANLHKIASEFERANSDKKTTAFTPAQILDNAIESVFGSVWFEQQVDCEKFRSETELHFSSQDDTLSKLGNSQLIDEDTLGRLKQMIRNVRDNQLKFINALEHIDSYDSFRKALQLQDESIDVSSVVPAILADYRQVMDDIIISYEKERNSQTTSANLTMLAELTPRFTESTQRLRDESLRNVERLELFIAK